MIRYLILTSFLLTALTAEAGSLEDRVDAYVEQSRQTQGIAVALLTSEGVTRVMSGRAGPGSAVTDETLFEIGSVTKVFTGLLLAQLSEEGVVSLDSTLGELMPEPWELDSKVASIRLQELATHTSGLPRLPKSAGMFWRQLVRSTDPYAGLENYDIFAAVADLQPEDLDSRGGFSYSNLGLALLGRLLEAASGEPYESLLQTRVLTPMELTQTSFTDRILDDPRLARPHRKNLRPARNWRLDAYNPAGGLSSDLDDMIAFLQAAMTAEPGSPLADSMTPHWTEDGGDRAFGLGWVISEGDHERMVWHNGRTGGYYAFIGFLPDSDRGVVMLSNTSHSGNGFAVSLLRDDDSPLEPERDWLFLGLTLLLVPLAPLMTHGFGKQARATLAGTAKRPTDLLHFTETLAGVAFVLAMAWKLGVWNLVPTVYWWVGLVASLGLLGAASPSVVRLPRWPRISKGRLAQRLVGMGSMVVLMLWAVFLL